MGIDGIGKPPIPPTAPTATGAVSGVANNTGETFRVGKAGPAEGAQPATLLDRLKGGELNLDQYLELRVNEAVTHLEGNLAPEQFEFVKQSLREQLRTDPVLIELVKRSTGMTPEPTDS